MGDFKKFGKKGDTFNRGPGGRPNLESRPGFNRGGDERREMFKATCAECGKPCEVPFRPSGDRPVYCKDCFAAMRPQDRDDRPDRGGRDFRSPSQNFPKRDLAPRQSSAGFAPRPSYTPPQQGSGEDKRLDDIKIQLSAIISKLDKLLNLFSNTAHPAPKASTKTLHDTLAKVIPVPPTETKKPKASPKKKSSAKKK